MEPQQEDHKHSVSDFGHHFIISGVSVWGGVTQRICFRVLHPISYGDQDGLGSPSIGVCGSAHTMGLTQIPASGMKILIWVQRMTDAIIG